LETLISDEVRENQQVHVVEEEEEYGWEGQTLFKEDEGGQHEQEDDQVEVVHDFCEGCACEH
jgi:hypothetical protein